MHVTHALLLKIGLAMILGGAVGIERELRSKSAGFRTMMLICLGATLFTIFSAIMGIPSSPDRIAANVVVGIGFLGAGVIFRSNNRVNGITTAASMWLVAALGVGIGSGYYIASIIGCLTIVTILFLFSFFDRVLDRMYQLREYKISYPYEENEQHKYERMMREYGLSIKSGSQSKIGNIITGTWIVTGSERRHLTFIESILHDNAVTEFSF